MAINGKKLSSLKIERHTNVSPQTVVTVVADKCDDAVLDRKNRRAWKGSDVPALMSPGVSVLFLSNYSKCVAEAISPNVSGKTKLYRFMHYYLPYELE